MVGLVILFFFCTQIPKVPTTGKLMKQMSSTFLAAAAAGSPFLDSPLDLFSQLQSLCFCVFYICRFPSDGKLVLRLLPHSASRFWNCFLLFTNIQTFLFALLHTLSLPSCMQGGRAFQIAYYLNCLIYIWLNLLRPQEPPRTEELIMQAWRRGMRGRSKHGLLPNRMWISTNNCVAFERLWQIWCWLVQLWTWLPRSQKL